MILNLIALAVFVAAAASGLTLLVRRSGDRGTGTAFATCGHCGASAAPLESFDCPTCGRDVRNKGLIRAGAVPASRFWKVIAWTAAAPVIAGILIELTRGFAVRRQGVSAQMTFSPDSPDAGEFEEIRAQFIGERRSADAVIGHLAADLYLRDGRVTTLEVAMPSKAGTLTDHAGRVTVLGEFDETAVQRWLASAGAVATTTSPGSVASPSPAAAIHADLAAMLDAGSVRPSARPRGGSWRGSGGHSIHAAVPPWFEPVTVAASAVVWLLGVFWLLGVPRGRGQRGPTAVRIGAGTRFDTEPAA